VSRNPDSLYHWFAGCIRIQRPCAYLGTEKSISQGLVLDGSKRAGPRNMLLDRESSFLVIANKQQESCCQWVEKRSMACSQLPWSLPSNGSQRFLDRHFPYESPQTIASRYEAFPEPHRSRLDCESVIRATISRGVFDEHGNLDDQHIQ
jgi:hypothetical protein